MIETEESLSPPAQIQNGEPDRPAEKPPSWNEDGNEAEEVVIRPRSGWIALDFKELFSHRELLYFFVWRDITARYKQTVLGSAWAILQPLLMMMIFTFIFGKFAKIPLPVDLPYPVVVFAALIPWTLFSQGMSQSALSLVNNQHMLTKVYFPRLYIPASAAAVFLVDVAYSLGIYGLILFYYGIVPSWTCVFVPFLVLLTLIATLSFGIMLSALTVFYRDFRHVVPFLTQIMMYCTPVIYTAGTIGPRYRLVMALNPMFGVIDAFRAAILGPSVVPLDVPCLAISSTTALVAFVIAVYYFRRTERKFADFA